jgi:dephospho-CoA kinase
LKASNSSIVDCPIIGLTGGIGSGKTTVAEAFRELGINTVDADYASRAVIEPGMAALESIREHFGSTIIQADGCLDRAALRSIVFSDPQQKNWLESLLHPLIREWIVEQLQNSTCPYVILESPLLLETDQHRLVDSVLLVDLPEELQIARASARDNNLADQIKRIIATQMPRQEKLSRADLVFDNSQPLETVAARVAVLHNQFLSLAKAKKEGNTL